MPVLQPLDPTGSAGCADQLQSVAAFLSRHQLSQ